MGYVLIKKFFPKLKNIDFKNNSEGLVEVNIITLPEKDIIKHLNENNDSKLLRYELDSDNKESFFGLCF